MKTIKYFTKKILIEYNNAAIREKRNRALKEHFLENYKMIGYIQLFIRYIMKKMR